MRLRRKDWEETQEFIFYQWLRYNQELREKEGKNRNEKH